MYIRIRFKAAVRQVTKILMASAVFLVPHQPALAASTDEYVSTLAKWFGVRASDIASIVPNISRFGDASDPFRDLGFMGPA